MKTYSKINKRHHSKSTKGMMGGAIIATAGIFFALHALLPEQKLWPAFLIVAGVVTILVSHYKKQGDKSLENN